jgi:AraC family transcriptional regulator, regulatory protein of adaptative response / DNA-3-methyladenine glycosylase II
MRLNAAICYRALATRDRQFDGRFFVGVTTTGIYCRPVCAARTPRRDKCRFFATAVEAERAGFRPCRRCRPELAPGQAPVDAVRRTARVAVARIAAGALDDCGDLERLARELGVSSRQLRRSVQRVYGASPARLANARRLRCACRMLLEGQSPIIDVAFASGFGSVRRFNALFRESYGMTPTQMRLRRQRHSAGARSFARTRIPR